MSTALHSNEVCRGKSGAYYLRMTGFQCSRYKNLWSMKKNKLDFFSTHVHLSMWLSFIMERPIKQQKIKSAWLALFFSLFKKRERKRKQTLGDCLGYYPFEGHWAIKGKNKLQGKKEKGALALLTASSFSPPTHSLPSFHSGLSK